MSGIVVWLFLTMPRLCLHFVIVLFPDHTHLLFLLHTKKAKAQINMRGLITALILVVHCQESVITKSASSFSQPVTYL